MWTPHFQFDMMSAEGGKPAEDLLAAYNDDASREFFVQFFLDDIRLRRREIQISGFDSPTSMTYTGPSGNRVRVYFNNNSNGRIDNVAFSVTDNNPIQATWYCFNRLSELLSYWSLVNGGSQCLYGIRVHDVKNELTYQSFPYTGTESIAPVPAFMPPDINLSAEHKKLLSLYREARNSSSPFYAFLCAFKIMEISNTPLFSETHKKLRSLNIDDSRNRAVITADMLEVARAHVSYPNFAGMRYDEFMGAVRSFRNSIAHGVSYEGDMFDFDNVNHFVEASILASLADLLAREVLVEEFRLLSLIAMAEAGPDSEPVQYVDNSKFIYLRIHPTGGHGPEERFLDTRD